MSFGQYAIDYEERVNFDRLRNDRLNKAKEQLKNSGLGALLCFDPANIRYITSTKEPIWAQIGLMCRYCVLPRGGDPVLFEIGSLGQARLEPDAATWLKGKVRPAVGWGRGSVPNYKQAADKAVKNIKQVLEENGVAKEPVGLDILDVTLLKALESNNMKYSDGQEVMLKARVDKTTDEIELLKLSAMVVDAAYYKLTHAIKPGVKECDLVGLGMQTCFSMGCEDIDCFNACSGPRTNPHHHDMSDRVLRPGELIFFDIVSSYNGYRTCYYRTFSIGKATKEMKDGYQKCYDWLYNSIKAVKPGVTTADIANKWPGPEVLGCKTEAEVLACQWGHGIGLGIWEFPVISRAFSFDLPFPIKKNMTFALETYYGPPGAKWGVRIEEMLVVTDTGAEVISKYPCDELIECPVTP